MIILIQSYLSPERKIFEFGLFFRGQIVLKSHDILCESYLALMRKMNDFGFFQMSESSKIIFTLR